MKIIKISLLLIASSFFSDAGFAFLGIGSGYDKRGEHCDGICNITEYNCDPRKLSLITPHDQDVRDAKKLPRILTQKYPPSEMRTWCKKNCFHKMPWKSFKNNPDKYFDNLCAPTRSVQELEIEKITAPILSPQQYFNFRSHAPESATLLNLVTMDDDFLKQTSDIKRAVGSVEFVALIHETLVNNIHVNTLSDKLMDRIAEDRVAAELLKVTRSPEVVNKYKNNKIVSIGDLSKVLQALKNGIFRVKGVKESDIKMPTPN
ncbi:MAG: hypothetical protein K2X53_05905 [Alphaproteobacteria bacterium]|nr:hypothetical protein [Alphaproteobacteria bacterium]